MPIEELLVRDPLVVAGIDPGTAVMGFGVIGRHAGVLQAVDHGAFRSPRGARMADRLQHMHACARHLFQHHRPDAVALEQAFFRKNVQSALRLGEARACVIIAARSLGIPVVEYPTAVAKKAVTGHGGASKEVVRQMVAEELGLAGLPEPLDAADALALALCLIHDPALDPRFRESGGADREKAGERAQGQSSPSR